MKATSVQNIKNVKDICISAATFPMGGREESLTIEIYTDDDIFEFNFEGQDLVQKCKKAGLFSGREKDQKIMKLEKELSKWKKEEADCLRLRDERKKESMQLKQENANLNQQLQQVKREKKELEGRYMSLDGVYRGLLNNYIQVKDKLDLERAANEEPHSRRDILRCAEKCVCGQREQDYGTPESNFQLIADLWNGYLGTKYRYVDDVKPINIAPLKPLDVSMMMALLKIARIKNGGGSGDSFVDLAGYAACGGEIWARQKHQKDQN